ncbi:MAG: hypothetical protein ACIARR_09275 [Phycisphaerales bacterium JB059]
MVICALGTMGVGIVLVWALIRPGVIESVGTAELAGVAGALLAPCLALLALRLDARVVRRERLELVIEDQIRAGAQIEARVLGEEASVDAEAEELEREIGEELSPVLARIYHDGETRRVSPARHTRHGVRVTAG